MTQDPKAKHRHEETDISIRNVLLWAGVLVGLVIFSMIVTWGIISVLFTMSERPVVDRRSVRVDATQTPSLPHLQSMPAVDLASYRAAQYKLLTTYGWADRTTGAVRIPIERAMSIVAASNLPVRTVPKKTASETPAPAAPAPAAPKVS